MTGRTNSIVDGRAHNFELFRNLNATYIIIGHRCKTPLSTIFFTS